jgi:hypothetical protein
MSCGLLASYMRWPKPSWGAPKGHGEVDQDVEKLVAGGKAQGAQLGELIQVDSLDINPEFLLHISEEPQDSLDAGSRHSPFPCETSCERQVITALRSTLEGYTTSL